MNNYYIDRDKDKNIVGLYARPQYEEQEFLPETDKKIVAFLKKQKDVVDEAQLSEQKIQAKIRQTAIESLKTKGELPADFEG